MTVDWARFAEIIRSHDDFLLTSHIRPDCDALGSELGLAEILRQLGKRVRIVNGHPTPPALAFLDPAERIEMLGRDVDEVDLNPQCMIVLDTSAFAQLGSMADVFRQTTARKLVVDHHVAEDEDLDAELFKDRGSEATGHLVVQAADALGVPLNSAMAVPLYAAIATDTGWYRFNSVTPETYRVAARLVEAGAEPWQIYEDLYEQDTLGRVKLRGRILSRVEAELSGQLVHTYVLKEDFEQTGAVPSDTEDAINLTLGISGTKAAVIMIEQLSGGFKMSFRSRCPLDCSEVARHFGGGGHKAAAGAFVDGVLQDVQARVLPVVRKRLQAACG